MREALDDMMIIENKKKDENYELTVMEASPILRIQVPTNVNGAFAHAQGKTNHIAAWASDGDASMQQVRRAMGILRFCFLDRCFFSRSITTRPSHQMDRDATTSEP